MSATKAAKRGRPPTDLVDRFRAKVWYWAVKARGQWSNYKLDIEFVREEAEEKRDGVTRRRSFGGIQQHGRVPSPATHRRRPFDLIERVDSHPNFSGTAKYFRSPLWDLLKANAMNLSEAYEFVSRCMALTQVHRPSGKFIVGKAMARSATAASIRPCLGEEYTAALRRIIETKPLDLELLALLGGLYREAYLACALDIAVVLKGMLLEQLANYCEQDWLREIGTQLFDFIEGRLFYWRIDRDNLEDKDYDSQVPAWVIERPLIAIDDTNRASIDSQDQLYDELMEEFLQMLAGDDKNADDIIDELKRRSPNLF